jgi:hypothetical protein
MHDWNIDVESKKTKYTTFTVMFTKWK